jgi:serine/threonine protein kinase, bacterial
MSESSPLIPGNVLGNRYEIIRELGRGGFGRTYLSIDRNKFGEKCVLKEFAPQVKGDAELKKAKELFEREAGVLYKLDHPQIPRFRELFRVSNHQIESLFLVQDYVEGETYLNLLNDRLQQGRVFSELEIIQLLSQLLPILEYIHVSGVIHRDISPDNIMYRHSDRLPVLIDFGGVKEIAVTAISRYSKAKVETRIGKQGYAPEEQMMRGKVSPSSDLYAVATTCLALMIGKEPGAIYSPSDAVWEWRKYLNLSPEFGNILDRLLQHNPQHRYQSAREVLNILPTNSHPIPFTPPAQANQQQYQPQSQPQISHPQVSQLPTITVSPKANPSGAMVTVLSQNPQEWKKPAGQVAKVMTKLFVVCLGGSIAIKWFKSIDPVKVVRDRVNDATGGIINSIPDPLGSLPTILKPKPSVAQRQQDLSKRLQQLNIPAGKFYRQVDRAFYLRHPELNRRPLTSNPDDERFRQEWQDIAVELLDKR